MLEFTGIFQQQDVEVGGGGGSAPTVVSITPHEITVAALDHDMPLPATVTSGDLLLMFAVSDGGTTDEPATAAAGWSKIESFSNSAAGAAIFKKIADGSEDGTTINITTASTEALSTQCFRIQTWSGNTNDVVVAATPVVQTSSANNITPPALTSGFGAVPTLWLVAHAQSHTIVTTDTPAGYTITLTGTLSTASGVLRSGWKTATAASETPGAFTYGSTQIASATTLAVKGN